MERRIRSNSSALTCTYLISERRFILSPSETREAGLVFLDTTGGTLRGDVNARSTFNHATATAASPVCVCFLESVFVCLLV